MLLPLGSVPDAVTVFTTGSVTSVVSAGTAKVSEMNSLGPHGQGRDGEVRAPPATGWVTVASNSVWIRVRPVGTMSVTVTSVRATLPVLVTVR